MGPPYERGVHNRRPHHFPANIGYVELVTRSCSCYELVGDGGQSTAESLFLAAVRPSSPQLRVLTKRTLVEVTKGDPVGQGGDAALDAVDFGGLSGDVLDVDTHEERARAASSIDPNICQGGVADSVMRVIGDRPTSGDTAGAAGMPGLIELYELKASVHDRVFPTRVYLHGRIAGSGPLITRGEFQIRLR